MPQQVKCIPIHFTRHYHTENTLASPRRAVLQRVNVEEQEAVC